MTPMTRWGVGLFVSLVVGWIVTMVFLSLLRRHIELPKDTSASQVPPSLTGLVERLFFTVAVAFDLSGTVPAMMGWLAVKMASNWNRPGDGGLQDPRGAVSALLAGLVSLGFALVGGLICRPPPY
jgi:hypothetical protein